MNRRDFMLTSAGAAVLPSLLLEGCTFQQGVDEFISIVNLMAPAVSGVVGIIELADPALVPAVQLVVTIFNKEVPVVTQAYNDWKTAAAANQPGFLGALEATITTLRQDGLSLLTASQVKDTNKQAAIDNLMNSVLQEIAEITALVNQVKTGGGTTAAALHVAKKHMGKPVITSAQFKKTVRTHLLRKTGDQPLDIYNAKLATKFQ
jgi:pyrroline-5-carboxylate reductase